MMKTILFLMLAYTAQAKTIICSTEGQALALELDEARGLEQIRVLNKSQFCQKAMDHSPKLLLEKSQYKIYEVNLTNCDSFWNGRLVLQKSNTPHWAILNFTWSTDERENGHSFRLDCHSLQ